MTITEINNRNEKIWQQRLLDLSGAYKNGLELLNLSESISHDIGIADSCKTLGYCFWRFSDYSLSLSHSLRALKIYSDHGDLKSKADTLNNLGAVYMFQNDNVKRLAVNIECQDIRRQVNDLEGIASSEGNIGETHFEMGNHKEAQKSFESVLNNEHSSPQGLSWAYHNIGKVHVMNKDWDLALSFFEKGLEVSQSVNYNVLIVDSYIEITDLFLKQNKLKEAKANAIKGREASIKIGAKDGEKKSLYFLSKIHELEGSFETSLKYHKDYHTIDIEIRNNSEIEQLKTAQIKAAFDKIEEQKNELIDSITYAKRIQKAVLARDPNQKLLRNFFVFYKPKDIVSGDFYWYYEKDNHFYLCVADCTGHGVPGAFLTMLGATFLNEIITLNQGISPAKILNKLRTRIIHALSQSSDSGNKDGMDISLIKVNCNNYQAEWAGANNPLVIIRSTEKGILKAKTISSDQFNLFEIKADKQPISIGEKMLPFTNHSIQLLKGDSIYLYSDGYSDQFGGKRGKKYLSLNLKKRLLSIQDKDIPKQQKALAKDFAKWKGHQEQVDDVCIFGFKL